MAVALPAVNPGLVMARGKERFPFSSFLFLRNKGTSPPSLLPDFALMFNWSQWDHVLFLKQSCQVERSDHGCLIDKPEPPPGAWTGNSFPGSAWLREGGWLPEPKPISLWNEEEGGQRLGGRPRVSLAAHLASTGSGLSAPLERGRSSAVCFPYSVLS